MTLNAQLNHLNPYHGNLTLEMQKELWQLANESVEVRESSRRWVKAWFTLFAFCFVAMLFLLCASVTSRSRRDTAVEQANARVLAMADQLAILKKQQQP